MGVEVVGSEMAHVPIETVAEVDNSFLHEKENGKLDMESGFKEPIKFGSHDEEPAKEADIVADAKFPKEAADEWPAPRQIHTFYFVRYRPFDDPKIKAKIDSADREIQRTNQSRFQILEELKAKRSVRAELMEHVKTLRNENDQYRTIVDEKRKEIEPLQQALGKLRNTNNAGRGGGLCSSEEELNDLINGLRYCIEHESIPLAEEKKILREIKQLEGTRDKVIANAAMRAKIQDSLGQKEAIQDQVKLMGVDLDGVRKEKQAVGTRIGQLKEKVKALDAEIKSLQDDLEAVTVKRDKAFENIKSLRQQRDDGNVHFYNSRKTITEAKDLAAKKDVQALEKLANEEVDKFMSLWSSNKAFRDDYEKRILPSLDMRQLSRDGRIRNPDEKPLVVVESAVQSEPEPVAKPNIKRAKEEPKPAAQKDIAASLKAQKESSKTGSKATSDHIDVADEIYVSEKRSPAKEEIDESKLKDLKREEEMVKAKQAMERKKKLAEKAAAKAAIRAQKEAEKKLKEREKKLKKKAAISAPSAEAEEPSEAVVDAAETEKVEVDDEPPAPSKERVRKENSVRYRTRPKGPDSLPKAILRKKKTTNYWTWAAVAALLLLVFAVTGYYYLH